MFVTPRKASTVSILRDISGKMEVLLMKRHLNDRFLPDYHVFPGGALDPQDYDFDFPENENITSLKDFDGNKKKYYGHVICGIRETFEESGLLFAVDNNGSYPEISTDDSLNKFSLYRKFVFEKHISFGDFLMRENLSPAINHFYYLNRWITPPLFPIRYDTRFFVSVMPENQKISHDGNELVDFEWLSPEDALQMYSDKIIKLVIPTIKTLEFLKKFKTSDEVTAFIQK